MISPCSYPQIAEGQITKNSFSEMEGSFFLFTIIRLPVFSTAHTTKEQNNKTNDYLDKRSYRSTSSGNSEVKPETAQDK